MNKFLDFLSKPFIWFFSSLKITNNSRSKVLSATFAIIFWLFVMDQENPEISKRIVNIPVELKNEQMLLDDGLVLMDKTEKYVEVEVRGRRNDVINVTAQDIKVTANLLGYGKGNASVALDKTILRENVVISDISQQEIKLFIDKIIEVPKPVDIGIIGKIKSGFIKDKMVVLPEEVLVKGPETYVNAVSGIKGELDVTNLTEDSNKEVAIYTVDNDGNMVSNIQLGVQYVDVQIGIKKVQSISVLPNLIGEINSNYKIVNVTLAPKEVVLKGHKNIIESIETLSTNPIDISNLTETTELEVDIIIPEESSIMYFEPPFKLNVEVEKVEEQVYEITPDDIQIKTADGFMEIDDDLVVGDGYQLFFGTEVSTIQLVVKEVSRVLADLSVDDFRVYIETTDLTAGTHTVPLLVEVIGKDIEVNIRPININISLIEKVQE